MDWKRSKVGNLWCEHAEGPDKITITVMRRHGREDFGLFGCYARDHKGFHPQSFPTESAAQAAAAEWARKLLAKRKAMRGAAHA